MPESFKWQFAARFRRRAFGWKSQPAIQRVKEAVSEIKAVARRDPLLAAEGAVLFLEKVSPALEQVDSSSGAIGTAVNKAIETLVPLIARAPADARAREAWLERLWEAYQADQMPYIERLGEHWGALCVSPELASHWADELIGTVRMAWSPDPGLRGFFPGTVNCLSALFHAERHEELLELRYAEASRGRNTSPVAIARACEEILLSSGMADDAYARYAIEANQANSYAATFRAIAKKYPGKRPAEILCDLVASTPGSGGKWFAAAKDAGLLDEAIALAKQSPCDPRTLTRAARDFAEVNPGFAHEAGLAALHWLVLGYGYDVTSADVWSAYHQTRKAAERLGRSAETRARIRALVAGETFGDRFVSKVLGAELEEGGKR
jgi:hypothetical protein